MKHISILFIGLIALSVITTCGLFGQAFPPSPVIDRVCEDSGSTDGYACDFSPRISSYRNEVYAFIANTPNSGAATISFNGLGPIAIKKQHDQDLADGDIEAGQFVVVFYDGAVMQMVSVAAQVSGGGDSVDPFDTSAPILLHEHFCGGLQTNGMVGELGWQWINSNNGSMIQGTELDYPCGYTLNGGAADTSIHGLFLGRNSQSAGQSYAGFDYSQLSTKPWHARMVFAGGPDATNTGVWVGLGDSDRLDTGSSDREGFGIRQSSDASDASWLAIIVDAGSVNAAACTAPGGGEDYTANRYYVLDMSGTGTSTVTLKLYESATSPEAAITGGVDIFDNGCTFTMPNFDEGFHPIFEVQSQEAVTKTLRAFEMISQVAR